MAAMSKWLTMTETSRRLNTAVTSTLLTMAATAMRLDLAETTRCLNTHCMTVKRRHGTVNLVKLGAIFA